MNRKVVIYLTWRGIGQQILCIRKCNNIKIKNYYLIYFFEFISTSIKHFSQLVSCFIPEIFNLKNHIPTQRFKSFLSTVTNIYILPAHILLSSVLLSKIHKISAVDTFKLYWYWYITSKIFKFFHAGVDFILSNI